MVLLLGLSQQSAQAQWILGVSSLTENSTAHTVQGTSSTQMDYNTQLYYYVYVRGYIYNQDPNVRLATQETASDGTASVNTQVSGTTPGATYNLRTEHYYWPIYPSCTFPGSCNKSDYFGYTFLQPMYTGVSQNGPTRTFFAPNQFSAYSAPNYIWLGNTNTSVRAAPAITITNTFVSGNLKGTTQNALLASPAGLQASVNPSNMNGNYVWSFTGPFVMDFTSQDNSFRSVFWTQPGTYIATVTYSGTGFSVTENVTIQVRVPTLTSFTGTSSGNVVDRGNNCSRIFSGQFLPYGATYSLGCSQNNPAGMLWSATATIPNVSYLSDLGDAGIEFKQIVSVSRTRMSQGRLLCFTARNPQSDPNTGWQLDATNPFFSDAYVIPTFQTSKNIMAQEFDAPARALDGRGNVDGTFFQNDAVSIDDRFETYVQYFTGSPRDPSFQILLHVADAQCPADRFDCGIDRLVWTWGGKVNYDSSVGPLLYRQVATTTTTGTVPLVRSNLARAYTGVAQQNSFTLCAGAPNTTNPIDGSRFFVRQLYLGFLNREPDVAGWDHWTSNITHCNVDTVCIYGNNLPQGWRFFTARAFFYAPDVWVRYPALANPPGSAGFDPSVYNPAFISACYNGFLGRDPDEAGFVYWVSQLDQYANYDPVMNSFLTCPEFRQRFGAVDPHY